MSWEGNHHQVCQPFYLPTYPPYLSLPLSIHTHYTCIYIGSSAASGSTTNMMNNNNAAPLTSKNELRGLTLRIARVVAMMNRYGYRVTPQSGAMLQVG